MIQDAALILVAGGSGTRYGKDNKLFVSLCGIPAFIHPVLRLGKEFPQDRRIMAVPEAELDKFAEILRASAPDVPFKLVPGGATRSDSVRHALAAVPDDVLYVAIHDAARPLADAELLHAVLKEARNSGAAVPGHAVADTLKRTDNAGSVVETVSRERLFAVSTPQCFKLAELRDAYRRDPGSRTDDAGIAEAAGYCVKVVEETCENLKLTYPGDLARLKQLLQGKNF